MKKAITLATALGFTLAIVAAGTASSAIPVPLDLLAGEVTVAPDFTVQVPPDGGDLVVHDASGAVVPACADGIDNDGDGLIDLKDPGCTDPFDPDETDVPGSPGGGAPGAGAPQTTPGAPVAKPGKKSKKGKPNKGTGGVQGPNGGTTDVKVQPPAATAPATTNPTLSAAGFGPAPLGVPNIVIDRFEIPPFLLPIYQACGTQYGVPWEVLASINRIETAFGTNLNVSSAGAVGWMQFIPSSWQMYGVDANNDGRKDPYNPVDAICAAARYLKAAGADTDLRQGIFAYNHANWYVDEVILYAKQYSQLPDDLIGSLTGLTDGAHFPVAANARYADAISGRAAARRSTTDSRKTGNAADVISASPTRRSVDIFSKDGAPIVAVNDGVIKAMGQNPKLGKFIVLQDAYGNRYTYAQLGSIAATHPVPKQHPLTAKDFQLVKPKGDPKPTATATAGTNDNATTAATPGAAAKPSSQPVNTEALRSRLAAINNSSGGNGQVSSPPDKRVPGYETFKGKIAGAFKFDPKTMKLQALKVGSKVTGGSVLGRVGTVTAGAAPHVSFAIRPAGRGAPTIDPKPILDGWKLLESTAIYGTRGADPFGDGNVTIGQVLLMDKTTLERRVLADPRLSIYACGRNDIQTGQIDRRVLAVMEYLAERGYNLTITSLKCGHPFLTTSGNVSAHISGNAVDIAAVNGIPIVGHQGPGTITEAVIKDLLKLQGTMRPAQIISLMDLGPPTFILADHYDHIHVGYTPLYGEGQAAQQLARILKPAQWQRLIGRIGQIDNPTVPIKPSKFSLPATGPNAPTAAERARAHAGD